MYSEQVRSSALGSYIALPTSHTCLLQKGRKSLRLICKYMSSWRYKLYSVAKYALLHRTKQESTMGHSRSLTWDSKYPKPKYGLHCLAVQTALVYALQQLLVGLQMTNTALLVPHDMQYL